MIQSVVAEGKAPFCVYGIYEQGALIHTNGFGAPETLAMHDTSALPESVPSQSTLPESTQRTSHETPYAHMRFRIASMSKSFTAAAVLRLVWQGRLDLDEPAATLLPELATTNAHDDDAFPITIADLLSMRSGLATDDAWADRQESMSHEELRQLLARGLRTVFRPGEGYEYSNIGFAILGEAVRTITGSELPDYVRTEFLEPLGLQETTYDYREADPSMLICGHHRAASGAWVFEEFTAPGAFSAIGGVISSVHDIARWNAWLGAGFSDNGLPREGALAEDIILPRRFRRLMQIGHNPIPPIARSGSNRGRLTRRATSEYQSYGYGLVVEHDARYGDIAHHSGGYPGYGSDMRWHLGSGIGIVTLANGRYATPGGVASQALSMLLDSACTPMSGSRSSHSRAGAAGARTIAGSSAVAARSIRLWPQTEIAMGRVCAMLQALPSFGCDAGVCLPALESLSDLFSMNIVMDSSLEQRAAELAAVLVQTGPLLGTRRSPVAGLLTGGAWRANRMTKCSPVDRSALGAIGAAATTGDPSILDMPGLGPIYASARANATGNDPTAATHVGHHAGKGVSPVRHDIADGEPGLRAVVANAGALTAQSPAQLSWTMPCERHPLRCSIRLNPLQPPEIESLDFAVADAPKTDDIVVIEPQARIIMDTATDIAEDDGQGSLREPFARQGRRNTGKHRNDNVGRHNAARDDSDERGHA
jgi:CubicO group peptidase (beta-lactamase class C family)